MPGKWLLRAAAIFNVLVGLVFLVGRGAIAPLAQLDPVRGTNILIANLAAVLIGSLGVLYGIMSFDVRRYRPLLPLGAAGKLAAVIVAAQFVWLTGGQSWRLPALAGGDLVFVAAFVRLYARTAPGRATRAG